MLYGSLGGNGILENRAGYDLGLGWRQHDGTWGWGLNATIGQGFSEAGNGSLRGTLGAELFTDRFDASLYGTLVDRREEGSSAVAAGTPSSSLLLDDHRLTMETIYAEGSLERAMNGLSGEVGGHLFGSDLGLTPALDLRVSLGGFYYFADNAGKASTGAGGAALPDVAYEDIYGGKAAAELRLYDPFGLGRDSSFFVGLGGRYDNQDQLSGTLTVGFRVAFGGKTGALPDGLHDRMTDPMRRDPVQFGQRDLPATSFEEDVFSAFSRTSAVIDSVWFADSAAGGGGPARRWIRPRWTRRWPAPPCPRAPAARPTSW